MRQVWAVALVGLALSGCLGPREYVESANYALRPDPQVEAATPTDLVLGVRPLDRAEPIKDDIAFRETDFRLQYYATARWAESPRDVVTRVLKDALVASGRFADVGDARDIRPDLLLTGELREFEEVRTEEGRFAVVTARLEVRNVRENAPIWAETLSSRVPVEGEGVGTLAAAMNRAVAEIAEHAVAGIVAADPDKG